MIAPARYRIAPPAIALFFAVFCLFLRCVPNGFINFDDPDYILGNPHIQQGLNWETVKWAFTTNRAANWHPLTWLSHALDWRLFHAHAKGHHIVNVFLHALSAAILFIVLRRMTGAHWRSLFVAAIFGMHPLRIESVAWASERKDVLSTLFWMLTMWAYVEWAQTSAGKKRGSGIFYALALVLFALGLMSKPMLVTLPFALLLLDYWPLERWTRPGELGRLVVEKIPFFALSLVACVTTYRVQQAGGAIKIETLHLSMGARIANACLSYVRYLGKFFLPVRLSVFYPLPASGQQPMGEVLAAAALLLVFTAIAVARMRRQPYLFTGWFWYLGTLLPVIGLVQVGEQAMADRYTYVPLIGFSIALTWAVCDLTRGREFRKVVLPAAAAVALAGCARLTLRQIPWWKDSETLFRRAIAVTPPNSLAQINLGCALAENGRVNEAISHFQQALDINKDAPEAHLNLGMVLLGQNDFEGAATHLETAVASKPSNDKARFFLSVALQGMQDWNDAAAQLEESIRLNPDYDAAHMRYGYVLVRLGHIEEAIPEYQAALRLNPGYIDALNNLGVAYSRLQRWDEAIPEFQQALRLNPGMVETHFNLGLVYESQGKLPEAIAEYREALRLDPSHVPSRAKLESLLNGQTGGASP